MRTRTREVVRMLATFRHSARCRRLRAAAAAQEARALADGASQDEVQEDERAESSAVDEWLASRKPHRGMH
ncbi:hypothetical protein AWB75_01366 [Caballeronia catudaia]|uniref:Uncharacterized protein n=1 Tax=Caballeronia catudaia TaxID=1777136 RepID=A0A157ZX99_9BURK|nr:hypothetical protein [Caballeronia catudaia]SAK50120.1 hypothetical protein AWB75_01366 [Caballeronia catudaia]